MHSRHIIIPFGSSELYVVPAMHFNHVFAMEVYNICSDPETRPDAIAVELGPKAAVSVWNWLNELGYENFPVMLGLLKRNRMIRASYRQKALQLQKETGRDLSELSPDLLHRELGYSAYSILCLSPTDSIIEAIRCGVELNIPVWGVDLDDMADGIYKPVCVQSKDAEINMDVFVENNAVYAERQRDDEIDQRREIVMAARIKTLIAQHKRILFTCGMAHWLKIRDLLYDTSIKPALPMNCLNVANEEFQRVVVHPIIAAQCMDLFPALAIEYQRQRTLRNGLWRSVNKRICLDSGAIFYDQVKEAYKKFFSVGLNNPQYRGTGIDIEKIPLFEGYLNNLSILNNRPIPDMFMTIKTAQELINKEFAQAFTDIFMKYPWVSHDSFPDLQVLRPSMNNRGEGISATLTIDGYKENEYFFLRSSPSGGLQSVEEILFEWEKRNKPEWVELLDSSLHTWLPWDRLISIMSLKAIKKSARRNIIKKSVLFEGNLLNGIDVKSTIRAFSRDEEHYYVHDYTKGNADHINFIDMFPVVWLLQPDKIKGNDWIILQVPLSYLENHVRDKILIWNIIKERGAHMIAIISYGNHTYINNSASEDKSIKCDREAGMIVFQPICWTNKQFAYWAELTNYQRCPFYNERLHAFNALKNLYKENYQIRIEEYDWTTAMILMALPFAKEVLPVVAPDEYEIDQVVYRRAREFGVQVSLVSLSHFSRSEIERVSMCHLVPVIRLEPQCVYSKEIEEIIGEKQIDNLHLVPKELLDFGNID